MKVHWQHLAVIKEESVALVRLYSVAIKLHICSRSLYSFITPSCALTINTAPSYFHISLPCTRSYVCTRSTQYESTDLQRRPFSAACLHRAVIERVPVYDTQLNVNGPSLTIATLGRLPPTHPHGWHMF